MTIESPYTKVKRLAATVGVNLEAWTPEDKAKAVLFLRKIHTSVIDWFKANEEEGTEYNIGVIEPITHRELASEEHGVTEEFMWRHLAEKVFDELRETTVYKDFWGFPIDELLKAEAVESVEDWILKVDAIPDSQIHNVTLTFEEVLPGDHPNFVRYRVIQSYRP